MFNMYWEVGRAIAEDEQSGAAKAKYGDHLLAEPSKSLTNESGKGFSQSNLYNMREFYSKYPIFQTLSGKLSWSHDPIFFFHGHHIGFL